MNTHFFNQMEQHSPDFTDVQLNAEEHKLHEIPSYRLRIGILGKSSAGKSSLCNALLGQDICPVSTMEDCTRSPQEVLLDMGGREIKLVDIPSAGEIQEWDGEYAKLYAKLLPKLDLVLWLVKADDRTTASDENFYKNVVKPHIEQGKPFFLILNQVDKVEPFREWDRENHKPSPGQALNIRRKADAVAAQFGLPVSKVIPVSAYEKYNLVKLMDEIAYTLSKEKNIDMDIFGSTKPW